jgi:hypothetical protein
MTLMVNAAGSTRNKAHVFCRHILWPCPVQSNTVELGRAQVFEAYKNSAVLFEPFHHIGIHVNKLEGK